MEQIEIMADSIWQHEITRFNVVVYALGGKEAKDRLPSDPPAIDDDTSIGWDQAPGRWNLGAMVNGEAVPVAPRLSPEEDQRLKEIAVAKLLGLSSAVARSRMKADPGTKQGRERRAQAKAEAEARAAAEASAASDFAAKLAEIEGQFGGSED